MSIIHDYAAIRQRCREISKDIFPDRDDPLKEELEDLDDIYEPVPRIPTVRAAPPSPNRLVRKKS
jgi:hypothetical protein